MICRKCNSSRVLDITAKCSDTFSCGLNGIEHEGYVPSDLGIGGGDYIDFRLCLDCGQMQGNFPKPISKLETDISDEDVGGFYYEFFEEGGSPYLSPHRVYAACNIAAKLCPKFNNFIEAFLKENSGSYLISRNLEMPRLEIFIKMYRDNNPYIKGDE